MIESNMLLHTVSSSSLPIHRLYLHHSQILPYTASIKFSPKKISLQHPIVLQIGGRNLENLAKATRLANAYDYDEINFNCGCPSPKVSGRGCFGAVHMLNPKFVGEAMSVIAANTNASVTVKYQIGVDDHNSYNELCDFIHIVSSLSPTKHFIIHSRKQVMPFFYWLMMKLGKDIKIVVKPTTKDGMTIGVQWQLEWEKPQIQLGKGFSFHICHVYQGKLLIKNVEMFMEPIFHIEPLRLRTMAFGVSLAEKIVTYLRPAENVRRQAMTLLLLALLLFAAAAFYFTRPSI